MSNLIVGAHAILYINGTPYAYVAELDPVINSPQKLLNGIDYLPPLDAAPGLLTYNVTAHIYRRKQGRGLEGDGLLPRWDQATKGKYFSAVVVDRRTQEILFQSHKNLIISQSWRLGKAIIIGQINWVGLDYTNDSETKRGSDSGNL
jgi:hypothetical protein